MRIYGNQLPLLITTFFIYTFIGATSVTYNLRIAESTRRKAQAKEFKNYNLAAAILIDQIRHRLDDHKQNIIAGLGTIIHVVSPYYLRIDFAAGHVRDTFCNQQFKRSQADDILLYGGYTHSLAPHLKASLSAIVGIPTHRDTAFIGLELGVGHWSIGTQLDTMWRYGNNEDHAFLGAFRYFRFFPRMVDIPALMTSTLFKFNPGNLIDLLFAHSSKFGKNRFEIGYNATFAFGATLNPTLSLIDNIDFIRNSFYGNHQYIFFIKKTPNAITSGISYGFDSKPKTLGFKSIWILWSSWGIAF